MKAEFRWNDWNLNMRPGTAFGLGGGARRAGGARPYPRRVRDDKWQVIGRGVGDRWVQVAYVIDRDGVYYIIHAMPMTGRRRR